MDSTILLKTVIFLSWVLVVANSHGKRAGVPVLGFEKGLTERLHLRTGGLNFHCVISRLLTPRVQTMI